MSEKIRRACAVALAHGYLYIWIDSCCIDKTSSAELSEAINSMYTWYQNAAVSYAFLADVPSDQNPRADNSAFRQSRWFTRGWTLQELLAPRVVLFLSRDWQVIGTKISLGHTIEHITTIPFSVLTFQSPLRDVSVARRLSWASNRRTTRVEDEAYSLIGIFDINMPTLYGEGQRAFIRLQEEILRRIPDQTLFTWGSRAEHTLQCTPDIRGTSWMMEREPLLATSVAEFASSGDLRPITHDELSSRLALPGGLPLPRYALSSYGVHTQVPLLSPMTNEGAMMELVYLLVLACELSAGSLIAVVCHVGQHSRGIHFIGVALHGGVACCRNDSRCRNGRLVILLPEDVKTVRRSVHIQDVYLDPGYFRSQNTSLQRVRDVSEDGRRIHLTPWSWDFLRRIGYTVAHNHLMQNGRASSLILHSDKEYISITLGRGPWMPIILDETLRWLDSNTTIRGVHTGRLRLLTTVVLTWVDASDNMDITYRGRSEFHSPSDGPGTCEVTMSWSLEANLLLFDIMLAYSP